MTTPTIKCQFEGVWRRFTVSPQSSFLDLVERCRTVFELDENEPLKLFYTDDEGDLIHFSTRPELEDAKRLASASASYALKLVMERASPEEEESDEEESDEEEERPAHRFVECDNCSMNPIVGVRYKCVECDDFDLCEGCEGKGAELLNHKASHSMLKMPTPMRLGSISRMQGCPRARAPHSCLRALPSAADDAIQSSSTQEQVCSLDDALVGVWLKGDGLIFRVEKDGKFFYGGRAREVDGQLTMLSVKGQGLVSDVTATGFSVDWERVHRCRWGVARFELNEHGQLVEKGSILWTKQGQTEPTEQVSQVQEAAQTEQGEEVEEKQIEQVDLSSGFPPALVGVWFREAQNLAFEITEAGNLVLADEKQTVTDVTSTGFTMNWPNPAWGQARFQLNEDGELMENGVHCWKKQSEVAAEEEEEEVCDADCNQTCEIQEKDEQQLVASQLDILNSLTLKNPSVEDAEVQSTHSEDTFVDVQPGFPLLNEIQAIPVTNEKEMTAQEIILLEMGFPDAEKNAQLLKECNNSVEQVLVRLLS